MKCIICEMEKKDTDILLKTQVDTTGEEICVCKFCAHYPNVGLQVFPKDKDGNFKPMPILKEWQINPNVILK